MGKLALKKPSTDRKVKRGKKKLAERCVKGTWIGIFPRTGEHVIALPSGEAIRVRTIHRLPAENRWDFVAIEAVKALPRKPIPSHEETEPVARTAEGEGEPVQTTSSGDAERVADGSKLERPQTK